MTRSTNRLAAILGGLAIALVVAGPALASPGRLQTAGGSVELAARTDTGIARCADAWLEAKADPTVANYQAVGFCEIDRRLATLDRLGDLLDDAGALTDAHQAALEDILDGARSGLQSLRTEIAADTTLASLRTDVRRIYTDFRVYVLDARQVALVRGDDRVAAAADRLDAAVVRLTEAIAEAKAKGKDVTAAQGHLDAVIAAIGKARDEVAGDADAVLAQTPAAWNAGTAKPVLDAARASLSAAHADLRTAVSEARATLAALR
jgi:hypothetical protein